MIHGEIGENVPGFADDGARGSPACALPAASSTVPAHAERAAPVPPELRPGGEFDAYLAQLAKDDQSSGTVLLAHPSRSVPARSYGMADTSRSILNGPNTIFKLALVSKCVTAVALGRLPLCPARSAQASTSWARRSPDRGER